MSQVIRKTGSVKRGIVAQDLLDERAKLAFDQEELSEFVGGGADRNNIWKKHVDRFGADDRLRNYIGFYDYTPNEMQIDLWKRIRVLYENHQEDYFGKAGVGPPYVDWIAYF